jgi:ADP-heptose:LPS heptosyltransferase
MIEERWRSARRILAIRLDNLGDVLLTTRHKHPEVIMHEVERGLDLVDAIGLTTNKLDLVLRVPTAARENIFEFLSMRNVDPLSPLFGIHPGCSMPARTYPGDMYASVIDLLVERLNATIVVTRAKDEQALVEEVLGRAQERNQKGVFACAGILPFPEFCALIEATDLVITNNTGPMHIAAAVKTPVVALFALTNPPEQWGPWRVPHRQLYHDVPCRICYKRICPYGHECLRLVTPQTVADAATELLIRTVPGAMEGSVKSREIVLQGDACVPPQPNTTPAPTRLKGNFIDVWEVTL